MKLVVDTSYGKEFGFCIYENEENSYDIDWGDGSSVKSEDVISNEVSHEYTGENKEYTVTISGVIKRLRRAYQKGANLIKIEQWGELGLTSLESGFSGCTNLREIASPTKNSFKDVTDFDSCFSETGITSIPENLFVNCPNVTNFAYCFSHTEIENIPDILFTNCPNVRNFEACFCDTKIKSIPEDLFIKCSNVTNFELTFSNCSNLTNYLELWKSDYYENGNKYVSETKSGYGCYADCESIQGFDDIPPYWKDNGPR